MKRKSKNNFQKLLLEIIFTFILAGLLSAVLAAGAVLLFSYLNMSGAQLSSYVNYVSGTLFGLIVGYKLKSLFADYKK